VSFRLESIPLLRPIDRVSDICASDGQAKQDKFHKEPAPATALLLALVYGRGATLATRCSLSIRASVVLVEIERLYRDDVVVIRELARLRREA
jgi:hypothetical protein